MDIGVVIKKYRKEAGTTQEEIGEDNMEMITMGNNITESTFMLLDHIRHGRVNPPRHILRACVLVCRDHLRLGGARRRSVFMYF